MPCSRLAPSPTGALHLGNARTFLINWAMARQHGWRLILRVEDLDSPRVKQGATQQAVDILKWLGMDWDDGPCFQSHDLEPYHVALEQLAEQGDIYPCHCTRKQIEAAALSAPHGDQHELRYPGTCRPAEPTPTSWLAHRDEGAAWRLRLPMCSGVGESTDFVDQFSGLQTGNVAAGVGDFLVATKLGLPAYQLAVVVDDNRQRVDQVVRGDDLLGSTHRQIWVRRALKIDTPLGYTHLPLVLGPDGRRLAKRHGDTRLVGYRDAGVPAERVLGLLAHWCGQPTELQPTGLQTASLQKRTAAEFLDSFLLDQVRPEPVTFTAEADAWLRA